MQLAHEPGRISCNKCNVIADASHSRISYRHGGLPGAGERQSAFVASGQHPTSRQLRRLDTGCALLVVSIPGLSSSDRRDDFSRRSRAASERHTRVGEAFRLCLLGDSDKLRLLMAGLKGRVLRTAKPPLSVRAGNAHSCSAAASAASTLLAAHGTSPARAVPTVRGRSV